MVEADRTSPDFLHYAKKRAIVTGGGSGIGRAIALGLAQHGANVVIIGRRESALLETASTAREKNFPGKVVTLNCDLSLESSPQSAVEDAVTDLQGIDLLVNAAAYLHREQTDDETTSEDVWDLILSTNVRAPYLLARAAVPFLRESRGCIVNISSIWAHVGARKQVAYSTSKAAIVEMTRSLALDLAEDGIRVNCICPSTTRTPLIYSGRAQFDEASVAAAHPLGRIGEPEDIANAVLFLGSNHAAGWITGTSLTVDGGYTAK